MSETLISTVFAQAIELGASDIHLVTNHPPTFRIDGRMVASEHATLDERTLTAALDALLNDAQREAWLTSKQLCFSWRRADLGMFRVALYSHLGRMEAAIRVGRTHLPTVEELGLPEALLEQTRKPNGLVLITGPTGVGKTTTLNALLGYIHNLSNCKIITIEDPIEFVMPAGKSIIVQQELGVDFSSFQGALVHALRQDPDVICVGEMRDYATIATALTAAETGHMVLATLHTTGAIGTISRIIDVFPPEAQNQVRVQLAQVLRATMSQTLLPRADGAGRVLAYELMPVTDAVRNVIRENRPIQLKSVMQTGASFGMVPLDRMLRDLYREGTIDYETALAHANDRNIIDS